MDSIARALQLFWMDDVAGSFDVHPRTRARSSPEHVFRTARQCRLRAGGPGAMVCQRHRVGITRRDDPSNREASGRRRLAGNGTSFESVEHLRFCHLVDGACSRSFRNELLLENMAPYAPCKYRSFLIARTYRAYHRPANAELQRIAGCHGPNRRLFLVVSIANCVGVPVGYLLLRRGLSGTWVLWALVLGIVIAGVARLWFASKLAAISIKSWVREVFFTAALCAVGSVGLSLALIQLLPDGFARLGVIGLANCLVVCTATWFIATSPAERAKLKAFGASVFARLAGNSPERAREVAGETV